MRARLLIFSFRFLAHIHTEQRISSPKKEKQGGEEEEEEKRKG